MNSQKKYPSNEFELLVNLQERLIDVPGNNYEVSIGDDAAVRQCSEKEKLIFTTDVSVENVHFKVEYMSFKEIGYRAMVSNISDCAAMGAIPDSALIQLTFPGSCRNLKYCINDLYCGFADACKRWKFPIVGGDLSSGPSWVIGITLIGKILDGRRVLKRTGVCAGDSLWVSGTPGCSAAGLAALNKWGRSAVPKQFAALLDAHIKPVPRIECGISLQENENVHAAMDLSDGLSKDCRTLAYENNLGLILFSDSTHIPAEMVELSSKLGISWENWYFHGGEEYELLFAASSEFVPASVSGAEKLQCIGTFTTEIDSVAVERNGRIEFLDMGSYDHVK